VPGMAHLVEYHVIALLGQQHAPPGELQPELAADQQHQGRTLLTSHPLRAPVTRWMNRSLDLNVITMPGIIGRLDMPQEPSPVTIRVHRSVTCIDRLRHEQGR